MNSPDVCPICECPYEKSVTTVLGGSITHPDASQVRTCFEPVDEIDGKGPGKKQDTAGTRLYYHSREQVMGDGVGRDEHERVELSDESP